MACKDNKNLAYPQIFCTFAVVFMRFSEYIPYYKRNLKIAFPVMLTQMGAALVGLFDSIMVGHYATADLAAVSFSNAVFFTFMLFSMGCLMGITPLVGYEVGRQTNQSRKHIHRLYTSGNILTFLVSIATMIGLFLVYPLMPYMGQEPIVVETARTYFLLITLSLLPMLYFTFFRHFLEGLGNTFVAMVVTVSINLMNIGLNWVFIYGHWGFPAMGATGAGIASLISRMLMPLVMAIILYARPIWRQYLIKHHRLIRYRLSAQRSFFFQHSGLSSFSAAVFQRSSPSATNGSDLSAQRSPRPLALLWKTGAPIGAQTFLETITFTLSFVFVGWISKEALAAHQIANQIADLTFMLALGIGAATTIRVSHQLGKGDLHALKMASNASIHLVLMINTIGAGLMISLRHYIPYIFTDDEAVVDIAAHLILFAGLFQYADGLQAVGSAMLRGIQDVKRPMQYAFVAYIVVALPVGLICMYPLHMGASGIWVGFIVGLALAAVLFHLRFAKLYRKLHRPLAS